MTISFISAYIAVRNVPIYVDEWTYITLAHFLMQGKLATLTSFQSLYNSLGYSGPTVILPWGPQPTGQPWLDHPFLISLLLIPILLADLPARTLPTLMSSVIGLMIYFLLRKEKVLALIAVVTWIAYLAANPILSMLFLDAGVSFFSVLTLMLTNEYLNGKRQRSYLYLGSAAAGLAAASKEFGLAAVLYFGIFVLYLRFRKKQSILSNAKPFLLSISIASAWYLFALLTAPRLFLSLVKINSHRYSLPGGSYIYSHIPNFFVTQPNLSNPFQITFGQLSPFMIAGFVGMIYLILRSFFSTRLRMPAIFACCYLAFMIPTEVYFYTMIPLFPLYCLGISCLIYDALTRTYFRKQRQLQALGPRHN